VLNPLQVGRRAARAHPRHGCEVRT